jgi:hypothetical protein
MLEDELRTLFTLQASADLPPERISLPTVRRKAVARRRRRDIAAIGSPILAACGVLAIALAGVLPAVGHGTAPLQNQSRVRAPKQFDLLVPFASFGWLPSAKHRSGPIETGTTSATEDRLERDGFELNTYAYGGCRKIPQKPELSCPPQPGTHTRLWERAPAVNGHAAYFVQESPAASIAWQYAPHGWAILWNPGRISLRTMIRVADAVVFGAHQPVEFAVQITRPSAGLAGLVNTLDFALRSGPLFAYRYSVFHHGSRALSVNISSWGGGCSSGRQTVINGHLVNFWHYSPGGTALCVEARGLVIEMNGPSNPSATYPLTIFRQLKILGANPKDWVKSPVR